jgi:hypothetical protein
VGEGGEAAGSKGAHRGARQFSGALNPITSNIFEVGTTQNVLRTFTWEPRPKIWV